AHTGGRSQEHGNPDAGGAQTMALESGRQVATWGTRVSAETNSSSVSRWGRGANDARRVSVRAAPADVGFRLCAVDRLRQRGQPYARACRKPPPAHLRTNRSGRAAVTA